LGREGVVAPNPAGITYLDGQRLRRSILAAADWLDAGRDELNRINVFPVPDGDTGTNFATTLRATAEKVRALRSATLPTVTKAMAEACIFGARGNSGMLLSQFLLGFREALGDRRRAFARDVARGMRAGADRLARSLDEPVEGTILTVSRDVADAAERSARETNNFEIFMRDVLMRAHVSLARTPELLPVLKEAGVVDAGAKAFVRVWEGVARLIEGDPILAAPEIPTYDVPDAAALTDVAVDRDYQYCTEVLMRGDVFPPTTEVRSALRALGGSIVVLAAEDLLKVHVHTDTPERVFELASRWGTIETTKADDMREQHRSGHGPRRRIAIVADSSCDLPDEVVDAHGIVVVPLQLIEGDKIYLDRVEIRGAELYERMRRQGERMSTSQPTPGALRESFEDAREQADEVIGVFIGGTLSGTLNSAQAAAKASELSGLNLVDSKSASFGVGLLALRAAELAEAGWATQDIVREMERIRERSGALFTVDTFENLLRSGRVGRGRAWLGSLLDIKPILEVDREGRVVPLDRVRGREALIGRVLEHLDRRLTPRPNALRLAVAHADAPDVAKQLRDELVRRYSPRDCLVNHVTAALGVHTGPGAWGIFYQIEDPPSVNEAERSPEQQAITRG
jgi:DegV family protein with EDD domain